MTLSARLLRWFDTAGRTLPWRGTQDAYRILVSEIMLQQTQVQRVIEYYHRWLKQFPDWEHLAKATNAEVIKAWAGLGYNRRGLMLRDIARKVVLHSEPTSEEGWRGLKGIGPYTAAALTVFSLHQKATPIDTNIRRVASRLLLGVPFPDPTHDTKLQIALKKELLTGSRFYDVPQAIFDLATLICTKQPACAICPMRAVCKAAPKFLTGNVKMPRAMIKKAQETKHRDKPFPDRIYRGRILAQVRLHPRGISKEKLGPLIDPSYDAEEDGAWLRRILDRLNKDQFLHEKQNRFFLSDVE